MPRKTEVQKARAALKKASLSQRRYILNELSKDPPTSGPKIAGTLGISHQRVYQVKAALVASGELKP